MAFTATSGTISLTRLKLAKGANLVSFSLRYYLMLKSSVLHSWNNPTS